MKGRGAASNPPNRFEKTSLVPLEIETGERDAPQTVFYADRTKTILARNDSPDIPFTYSINPYRGCEHGCIYCYARPSHEYLGFSAGTDFESRILVKTDGAELLAKAFRAKSWTPQMVCLSGNTDCYQPVERTLGLTRKLLEVFLDFRNPVGIITKNHLVTRDIDLLSRLAALDLTSVTVSVTSLDENLIRTMEPRTSTAALRLEAMSRLAAAGIPVSVNVAPVIPGLNDHEIPEILRRARDHGATSAQMILLRLPGPVEPLFLEWLKRELPAKASKIESRIRDSRGGTLNDGTFGRRMSGEGITAEAIKLLFELSVARLSLDKRQNHFALHHFRDPEDRQMGIFDESGEHEGKT